MRSRRWTARHGVNAGPHDNLGQEALVSTELPESVAAQGREVCKDEVAVVGGGLAALFCAERLAELGYSVTLFRARSRLSATQMEHDHNTVFTRPGSAFFDYGCQLITAGNPWFREKMQQYEAQGLCYRPDVRVLSKEGGLQTFPEAPGWAGAHGMWQFQERMVEDVVTRNKIKLVSTATSWPPKPGTRFPDSPLLVDDYQLGPEGWILSNQKGTKFGPFSTLCGAFNSQVMLNVQLKRPEVARMREYLKQARFATPIVAMVAFDQSLEVDFTSAFVAGDRCLGWVSNNNKKVAAGEQFSSRRELWTLIGTADYSYRLFEEFGTRGYKKIALRDFLESFGQLIGKQLQRFGPEAVRIMHWETGIEANTVPSDAGCLWDAEKRLGWCGSWATFGSAEGAALSGRCLAEVVAAGSQQPDLCYPSGPWPEAACRLRSGYVRLSHGFFYLPDRPPCLTSIDPPASAGTEDHEKFWNAMGGHWIGEEGFEKTGAARCHGKGKSSWLPRKGKGKGTSGRSR